MIQKRVDAGFFFLFYIQTWQWRWKLWTKQKKQMINQPVVNIPPGQIRAFERAPQDFTPLCIH